MNIKVGILAMTIGVMLTGCSSGNISSDKLDDISSKVDGIQENLDNLEKEVTELKGETTEKVKFKIYTADENDTDKVIEFGNIELDSSKSKEDMLNEICSALQKEYFKDENAKIQVKSIDKDGIATINLENIDAWKSHFQGSTGGYISQFTITETLLQKEYKGDWIKGLEVLIDGQADYEFDHASFNQTFTR